MSEFERIDTSKFEALTETETIAMSGGISVGLTTEPDGTSDEVYDYPTW